MIAIMKDPSYVPPCVIKSQKPFEEAYPVLHKFLGKKYWTR